MVKYSSRVGAKPKVKKTTKPKLKMSSTGDELSQQQVFSPSVGAAQPSGGALSSGGVLQTGGALSSGGSLGTGGSIPTGGALPRVAQVAKAVIPKVKAAVQRLRTPEDVDNMSWEQMIHTLGSMTAEQHHVLQGLASSMLGMPHPLAAHIKAGLGGSFVHPKSVARMATRDILKAPTAQKLSQALHAEWMDMMAGKDVGGGLFSSLKMLLKKGVSGAKSAIGSVAEGAKGAVRALAAGAGTAQMVGKSVSNAIDKGLQVASVLQPAVSAVAPGLGEKLEAGTAAAQRLQGLVQQGTGIAGQVSTGLQPIVQSLGAVNAPVVAPEELLAQLQ